MNKHRHTQELEDRVAAERLREQRLTREDVFARIVSGDTARAAGNLIFHTPPEQFSQRLDWLAHRIEDLNRGGGDTDNGPSQNRPVSILEFLTDLSIDLQSFLPDWQLVPQLSRAEVAKAAERVISCLQKAEAEEPEAARKVREQIQTETLARLAAEDVTDPDERERLCQEFLGSSLSDHVRRMGREIQSSNFLTVARARKAGETTTEFGNDYAVFLRHVIRLGGSFVTTNPVLIKVAWDTDPGVWDERVDQIIRSRLTPQEIRDGLDRRETEEEMVAAINSAVTMAVVVENCRLLRDIFLVTEGKEGYVSLQVNPKMHDDAQRMASEATALYAELEKTLDGVPNVVFKLPSTAAGLAAAGTLTSSGIGVTITLTFSVFQARGFAQVLNRGHQLMSYIAIMNGRMAFPARDELVDRGVAGGAEASRWAGVEVARKAARTLYRTPKEGGLGVDRQKVKIMIASLRIYEDWIPDISELWGIPLITVFPNVRRAYDAHPRPFNGTTVENPTPPEAVTTLCESEIFRQAWWDSEDPPDLAPEVRLTLERDRSSLLAGWPPVANTLNQFIDLYEQMGRLVVGRLERTAAEEGALR